MYSVMRTRLAVATAAAAAAAKTKARDGGALRVLATSGGPDKPPQGVGNSSNNIEVNYVD